MTTTPPEDSSTTEFSGWRIAGLASVVMVMTSPGQTIGVSVFTDPMIEGLDLTRDQVSLAYLLGTLGGATLLPLMGRRIDRYGLRTMMTLIAAAFGMALIGMSQVQGFLTLALGYIGIRLLGQGSLSLTTSVAVGLWFDRNRGTAAGIVAAVSSACMALMPFALNAFIGFTSWRMAWVIAAIMVWLVVIPIAQFFMIDSPAAVGQIPDGHAFHASRDTSGDPETRRPSATRAEALRNPAFWLLVAVVSVPSMLTTALNFHQIAILGERGISENQAAALFLPQFIGPLLSGLVFGRLADRVKPRVLMAAAMTMLTLTHGLLWASGSVPVAIVYGVAMGITAGSVRAISTTLYPRWFGTAELGAIMGVAATLNVGSSAAGPFVLSIAKTALDQFQLPVLLLGAIPFTLALVVALTPDRRVPELAMLD